MDGNNTQPNNDPDGGLKVLHTYSSDMADAVRENNTSVIKIALAEKEKREREATYQAASGTPISKILFFLGGILLLGAAVAAGYFVMKKNKAENAPVVIQKDIGALIAYDQKVFIDTTGFTNQADFENAIRAEVEKPNTDIKAIFLSTSLSGTPALLSKERFFSLSGSTAPEVLKRTFAESYMIGSYQSHLFLIFKPVDYPQAYASMLGWEKTILSDFFLMFGVDISGDRSTLFEKSWSDTIIKNRDIRALFDNEGNPVLYYAFPDKGTLLITAKEDAIAEITARLQKTTAKPL